MFSHGGSVIQNILANYNTLDKNSKFHFFVVLPMYTYRGEIWKTHLSMAYISKIL